MTHGEHSFTDIKSDFTVVAELGHEAKAVVLGAMPLDERLSRDALQDIVQLVATGGDEDIWTPSVDTDQNHDDQYPHLDNQPWLLGHRLIGYYMRRFSTIGIVDSTHIARAKPKWSYGVTDYGSRIARPIAGHLLDLSEHSEQSLIQIFGPPKPGPDGIRPWQRRLAALDLLAHSDSPKVRIGEFAGVMGTNKRIASEILKGMAKEDLVETSQQSRINRVARYTVAPQIIDMNIKPTASSLYIDIVDILKEHRLVAPELPISNKEIATRLSKKYETNPKDRKLALEVAKRMNKIAERADRVIVKLGENDAVYAWLTSEQHELADHLLDFAEGVSTLDPEFLAEGAEKLEQKLEEPDIINYLLGKAKHTSSGIKSLPEERREYRQVIEETVLGLTDVTTEELNILLREQGVVLSINALRRHLNEIGNDKHKIIRGPGANYRDEMVA